MFEPMKTFAKLQLAPIQPPRQHARFASEQPGARKVKDDGGAWNECQHYTDCQKNDRCHRFFFFAIFALVIGIILFNIVKGVGEWASNNAQPRLTNEAKVVSKRTEVSGHHEHTSTSYYVTFELQGGERKELSVSGREFGQLSEGDTGQLTHQGTRYLGFFRQPRRAEPPVIEPPIPTNLVCAYCGNAIPAGRIKCDGCGWTWKPAPVATCD